MEQKKLKGFEPKHILWALQFLKVYSSENVSAGVWKCDEKTVRKWTGTVLENISYLKIVSFLFLSINVFNSHCFQSLTYISH